MRQRILKQLWPVAVACMLALGVFAFSEALVNPRLETRNDNLRTELAKIQGRNQQLRVEIGAIRAEVQRLESGPEESLNHARTETGMVRTGEVVYQFAEPGARP